MGERQLSYAARAHGESKTYNICISVVAEYVKKRDDVLVPYEIHDVNFSRNSSVYRMLFPVIRVRTLLHELDSDFASVDAPASLKDDAESASSEFISKLILINEVLKEVVVVGQVRAYGGSQDGGRMCGTRRPRYLR